MDSLIAYLKNSSLITLALLVTFVGLALVAVVLEAISWETLGDWTLKATLVALIVVVASAVVGLISSVAKK